MLLQSIFPVAVLRFSALRHAQTALRPHEVADA